jgi:glucose-1-phosphate adenylyltransferase
MEKVLGLIMAGGESKRLSTLTAERAKPAVPFGGKYRIIDFTLSNCAHSGLYNVALLTQFNPGSLVQHVGGGGAWNMERAAGGLRLLHPFTSRTRRSWYRGTADAVYQNRSYVEDQPVDEVLILSGDQIYTMNYERMVRFHREKAADITIGLTRVPMEDASRFGIVSVDRQGKVIDFTEKPAKPKSNLISMGIYIFKKDLLLQILGEDTNRKRTEHDFGRDILPGIVKNYKVFGYRYNGYYRDVGTVVAYWQTNMDMLTDPPKLNLFTDQYRVQTALSNQNMPPVKFGPFAQVSNSIISDGAVISGKVHNSVISPGVYIEEGTEVYDSIIFNDSVVKKGAIINYCILDKQVTINEQAQVGWGDDFTPNQEQPEYLHTGITLIGKRAKIPERIKIGRNCRVAPRTQISSFTDNTVPSGSTIYPKRRRQ